MQPLEDQHVVLFQFQFGSGHAASLVKVEARQPHRFSRQQRVDVIVQQLGVHRLDRLEVALAVLVQRTLVAVHEVIVQRDRHGAPAGHFQLDAQLVRRRRLAGSRRAGDGDHAALGDAQKILRHLGDLLGVKRFDMRISSLPPSRATASQISTRLTTWSLRIQSA